MIQMELNDGFKVPATKDYADVSILRQRMERLSCGSILPHTIKEQ